MILSDKATLAVAATAGMATVAQVLGAVESALPGGAGGHSKATTIAKTALGKIAQKLPAMGARKVASLVGGPAAPAIAFASLSVDAFEVVVAIKDSIAEHK